MPEYWFSARSACIELLNGQYHSMSLPDVPPQAFVYLRPWVQHGWEMVLLAAELLRQNSHLVTYGPQSFSSSYSEQCKISLEAWEWTSAQLQCALEDVRFSAISKDRKGWLALHKPYPWVLERLNNFACENIDWAVLTTKGRDFAVELLDHMQLSPALIFGHESGDKTYVLQEILADRLIQGFVEDRRETLEQVLSIVELSSIPCFLASWGYLKPEQDELNLPRGIHLLNPETMAAPLASWH